MKRAQTPAADCGCGSKLWIFLLIGAAVFLTLLAGFLLVGGIVVMWLVMSSHSMAPAPAPLPPAPPVPLQMPDLLGLGQVGIGILLSGALLLLLLIVILLIVLLFCSCGKPAWIKDLLKFLPMLKDVRAALITTADAMAAIEQGLRAAEVPVEAAGRLLKEAGDQANISIPTVSPQFKHFDLIGADVVVGLTQGSWSPFGELRNKLSDTGSKLKDSPDGLKAKLDDAADGCHSASVALRTIADVLPTT